MANILEPIKKHQKFKKSAYELCTSRATYNNVAVNMQPAGWAALT